MTENNRTFDEWFNKIAAHHQAIDVCERKVKEIIDQYLLEFFRDRDVKFKLIDNKWDPINRYVLPEGTYPNFKHNHSPMYNINPYTLEVTFQWWKEKNNKGNKIVWNPREETILNLYNKKLKKVFKLI